MAALSCYHLDEQGSNAQARLLYDFRQGSYDTRLLIRVLERLHRFLDHQPVTLVWDDRMCGGLGRPDVRAGQPIWRDLRVRVPPPAPAPARAEGLHLLARERRDSTCSRGSRAAAGQPVTPARSSSGVMRSTSRLW